MSLNAWFISVLAVCILAFSYGIKVSGITDGLCIIGFGILGFQIDRRGGAAYARALGLIAEQPTASGNLDALTREDLVARVPMFAGLDVKAQISIAHLLRARTAAPDEVIVRKGERGDAMYFISSGSVEVRIAPVPVPLGAGDFFGELALLVADRRSADVVALERCDLFTLAARDLRRLFGTEPRLRDQIHALAQSRVAAQSYDRKTAALDV